MFICKAEQCPHRLTQTLYCSKCQGESKHVHETIMIINEIDRQGEIWQELKNNVTNTFQTVDSLYSKYKPVIEYLEHSMMIPQVVIPA